ncbi:isochorismatase family protein family [Talaromyces proteolyticus]|uniref:Isochorismatase family protein family n=1 Tax=Talaromyces proteolyticus TaxID=1131652 RepID=A0AAD4KS05_9EURO|nr:isochorismatase family protein family [Talaromyces proteolyticus]KAH8694232.1 isochorismatase family protein family [Talaromyces proteolyticus]
MSAPALLPSFFNLPSIQTRKALLLLDFQNDFVRPNGRLPVGNAQDFLDQIPGLAQSFRRNGEVVWVRTQFEEPRPVVDPDYGGERIIISAGSLDSKNQKKGHRGRGGSRSNIEVNEGIDPEAFLSGPDPACQPQTSGVQFPAPILTAIDHDHDIVIEKSDYSALQSPGLVLSLRSRFVTELYLCGSLSNVSVYATALDAAQQGFTITLVEDCMGFRSFARHEEAVRRLADIVGANGISAQELLEDQDWQETQEIARATTPGRQPDGPQRSSPSQQTRTTTPAGIEGVLDHLAVKNSPPASRSSPAKQRLTDSSRSTGENSTFHDSIEIEADDNIDDDDDGPVILPPSKYLRASTRGLRETRPQGPNHARMRRPKTDRHSPSSSRRPGSSSVESAPRRASTSPVLTTTKAPNASPPTPPKHPASAPLTSSPSSIPKRKNKVSNNTLGPNDVIAEGDSRIIYNLNLPLDAFAEIHEEVNWQKMYHMSGQVPRLVAVQGAILPDNSIPIYRHPADESPILEPFTPTVNTVRIAAEKILGHPLNHVLIQLYRDGQDRISEHSDKTLDIVRGSSIVNVSLGAKRTMTLRTKLSALTGNEVETDNDTGSGRQKQQVPMPHESMFVLGPISNMRWLHGIRPDKRPESAKSPEEKDFNGERISLTFRNIGTFINPESQTIWGQGAVSKRSNAPRRVIHGNAAEAEKLIQAFGMENRETEFDWDTVYGGGFDVVNFIEPVVARVLLSGDTIADMRVRLCLVENGMRYETVSAASNPNAHQTTYISPDGNTSVIGDVQILLFMASMDQNSPLARAGVNFIRGGSRLAEITHLGTAWRKHLLNSRSADFEELSFWNGQVQDAELTREHHYIAGPLFTVDDIALWSILDGVQQRRGIIAGSTRYPYLSSYYQRVEKRGCVRVVKDEMSSETA